MRLKYWDVGAEDDSAIVSVVLEADVGFPAGLEKKESYPDGTL